MYTRHRCGPSGKTPPKIHGAFRGVEFWRKIAILSYPILYYNILYYNIRGVEFWRAIFRREVPDRSIGQTRRQITLGYESD